MPARTTICSLLILIACLSVAAGLLAASGRIDLKKYNRGPVLPSLHSPTRTQRLFLNRILVDMEELTEENEVVLDKDDNRFSHIRTILKLEKGDSVKLGVVDLGKTDAGMVVSVDKDKVVVSLGLPSALDKSSHARDLACRVDIVLAVPRPLRLERLLPVISCMGVGQLMLVGAAKVEKDYFGSHLFRYPKEVRRGLTEGLSQAAVDVRLPHVLVCKRLGDFFTAELDARFPRETYKRVIAHPPSASVEGAEQRLTTLPLDREFPTQRRIVVAVGPEGGWESNEVAMFIAAGFEPVSLGARILRTDMAVPVVLGLAHEWAELQARGRCSRGDE